MGARAKSLRRPGRLALIVCLLFALVGAWSGATFAAFTSTANNPNNRVTAAPDWAGPTVSGGIASTNGGLGRISQGDTVYLYLNVVDSGNPASGVASVTASVSVPGYGVLTLPVTAGNYNHRGITYNYRSAAQPLPVPFAEQTLPVTVTATDNASNSTTTNIPVVVDNSGPSGDDIDTTNRAGGTAGRAEQGDSITYTFSEAMDPYSFIDDWDGGDHNVTLRITNATGTNGDYVTIRNGNTEIPLGRVYLRNTGYVTTTRNFTNSTMTMTGNSITIVLGTASGSVGTVNVNGANDMRWTPDEDATDLAGNDASDDQVTESGNDREF